MAYQTTQFRIIELKIITSAGEEVDISQLFDELNIFDNMMTPCMSGNILIRDAVGLINKLKLNGDEYLRVVIDKGPDLGNTFMFRKGFRLYKISNRVRQTLTSETYVIHFLSPEFLFSEQQKIRQYYKDNYTNIVKTILSSYLKVELSSPGTSLNSGIANFLDSTGVHEVIIPNLSPFSAIEWIAKRAVWKNNRPDYFFYESQIGYSFAPLSWSLSYNEPRYTLNFNPKNMGLDEGREILGVREFKVLSQINVADNVSSGVYAGTFFGFDPLTKTVRLNKYTHDDVFGTNEYGNQYPNIAKDGRTKDGRLMTQMYDSRVVSYPFQMSRMENNPAAQYIKDNSPNISNYVDNTQEYMLQRKSIISNLTQKRARLTLPGNFGLFSGTVVQLDFPSYSSTSIESSTSKSVDRGMNGKYIIIGSRNIIRYDKHETIIEVATDSTNENYG